MGQRTLAWHGRLDGAPCEASSLMPKGVAAFPSSARRSGEAPMMDNAFVIRFCVRESRLLRCIQRGFGREGVYRVQAF
jgi:hypothetical protein